MRVLHRLRLFVGYRLGSLSGWVLPWDKTWMEGRRRAYIEREVERQVESRLAETRRAVATPDGPVTVKPHEVTS